MKLRQLWELHNFREVCVIFLVKKIIQVYVIKMSTFYVHLLNPDVQTLGTEGIFTGEITQPEAGLLTLPIEISLSAIKSHFKFKCVALGDDSDDLTLSNIDITGVTGVADEEAAAWTFPAAGDASADSMRSNFVALLSQKVFGSAGAADLFSNRTAIEDAWHTAAAAALVSLKANTYDFGITASKELIDAMFHSSNAKGIRFSMAYDAATDTAVSPAAGVRGTNVSVTGASGSGASVDVTAEGISVKTTGSGYVAGGVISMGDLSLTINSVQAAMLNGTLPDAAGTEVPLIVGDKIKVIYQIDSHPDQEDVSGDAVAVAQRFNVEYEMVA
jgi:hypothetical protein